VIALRRAAEGSDLLAAELVTAFVRGDPTPEAAAGALIVTEALGTIIGIGRGLARR
jgi:hypothetical protein